MPALGGDAEQAWRAVNRTVAAVGSDLERFHFNRAVARIRELTNLLEEFDTVRGELVSRLINLTLADWAKEATHDAGGHIALVDEIEEHVEFDGVYSYFFKGRTQKGVRTEDTRGVWTSSRFEVGDLLMFHCCAVHRSLPNVSGLIRLSLNTITYPARRPTMWQAERTGPELEVFRAEVERICKDQDIVGDRFEEIQLMAFKQGDDPSPELIAQLERRLSCRRLERRLSCRRARGG